MQAFEDKFTEIKKMKFLSKPDKSGTVLASIGIGD